MITADAVRELLADRKVFGDLPADLGDDAPIVLDSMALVWLLHQVEIRFGLRVDPSDEDLDRFSSVAGIVEYLNVEVAR